MFAPRICTVSFQKAYGKGLLKIYDASTASYAENKCLTYQRYACALFSASSLYLHRLFPKALAMVSTSSLFKRLTARSSGRTGISVVPRSNKFFVGKTRRWKVYTDVHFRTATDGGGSMQQQVFREKNLSLNSVQGCTLFNSGKDCRGGEAVPEEWSREQQPQLNLGFCDCIAKSRPNY